MILLLPILGGALAPQPALAQDWDETTCKEIDAAQLGKDTGRLKFNAKVLAIVGPDELLIRKKEDLPLILDPRLAAGGVLSSLHEGDNIRAFGFITTVRGRGGQVFKVMNLIKRPDDLTLYKQEIGSLEKKGDMLGLYKLGHDIEAEGESQKRQAQYKPIAREAYTAGVGLKEKVAKPDDPDAWISLAQDYLKLLGDRQGALDRLTKAIKPGEAAKSPAVLQLLEQLDALLYGGQYVLREEMKKREGFVERGGKWVLKERADFDDAVEQQRQLRAKHRKLLADYYAEVARQGAIELGMYKTEVAQAIGFPDEVDRQRLGPDVYDAWTYDGRGTFFFENNELFRRPDAPR